MSILSVTTINTANGTTDLALTTGNTSSGGLLLYSNGAGLVVSTGIIANGSVGTAGQVLASNGSTGTPYWSSAGGIIRAPQILTSGTSYTTPSNCTKIYVELVGGGGGSGGSPGTPYGGCGGGGGGGVAKFFTVTASTSYTYAIGAAGTAGTSAAAGGAGGSTTFTVGATTITAGGGAGGQLGSATAGVASGGTATNGDINIVGRSSGRAGGNVTYINNIGSEGGSPGIAYFGVGGPANYAVGAGIVGSGYGAGGGGGAGGTQVGAAGTQGVIRVWEYT